MLKVAGGSTCSRVIWKLRHVESASREHGHGLHGEVLSPLKLNGRSIRRSGEAHHIGHKLLALGAGHTVIQYERILRDDPREARRHILDVLDRPVWEACRHDRGFIDACAPVRPRKVVRPGLELPIQDVIKVRHDWIPCGLMAVRVILRPLPWPDRAAQRREA
jgi:hypothetical protein